MSEKFSLNVVKLSLRAKLDEPTTQALLLEMARLHNEEKASKPEKEAPEKKVLTVLHPEDTTEICWIISHPESMPPAVIPEKLSCAVNDYNMSKRGRLHPCKSLGDGLEVVGAKFFTHYGLSVRTKLPVSLLSVGREIVVPVGADAAA